ncbi:phospho-N-acetylmuramoyl-pentapeptide-transferase homolog isoform X1 [Macadamia integrifolia]|uniref:phospho-N-acetylmuramoyl-pentapeptide- transferase homolog isoform X1 n=1 Tax=Macadamia integrifolia TaxID=60698 RepID=UPI001C52F301|nr:phospho-N-acetylmuramoyl-pentapeptide-transferase homolog isoform X1 [Macadamia integrifolia]
MLSHSPDLPRTHSGVLQTLKRSESNLRRTLIPIDSPTCNRRFSCSLKLSDSDVSWRGSTTLRRNLFRIGNMDEDSVGISSLDEWEYGDSEEILESNSYILSSSEGEDSDIEITQFLVNPTRDVDLPNTRDHLENLDISDGTIAVTADRLGVLRKRRRVYRIQPGVFITTGLVVFLVMLLLFVDWWSWRIVKLPLKSFFLTQPFFVSAIVTSFSGFIFVPLLNSLKIHQIFRNEGPVTHSTRKRRTPTMGGLFFIPVGISVARAVAGLSSVEVSGVAVATIAFAVIGLLDDISSFIKNHNYGLPAWLKLFLEVAVGISFWFWLDSTHISSPYSMRMLVPLPSPLGLIYLGKLYPILTAFCFVSMGNGVNLTDGLDGLAGGTVALAFIGMSIAVLPICSDIAIFGASMAGACVGFLMHNRYKASVFMGDVGSLALGGALAAMATCTGMFFPLFISSGVFVLEALSVILQVSHFKMTKRLYGAGRRLFRMSPLHHHLELCGIREQFIVTMAYFISSALAILAGYVGLVSA